MSERRKTPNRSRKPGRFISLVLIGSGLLILGVVAFLFLLKPQEAAVSGAERLAIPAEVSYTAPELSLTDLNGNPVALADYLGTVVLVNNWATWCPPCKAEMPTLQAYYEAHHAEGFTIVAIESGDPLPEIVSFIQEYGLTFPVWPDISMKSISAFRNNGLPSSYVIDRSGTVRLAWAGAVNRDALEKYVNPLLEE